MIKTKRNIEIYNEYEISQLRKLYSEYTELVQTYPNRVDIKQRIVEIQKSLKENDERQQRKKDIDRMYYG